MALTTSQTRMKSIYAKLKATGLDTRYVKTFLLPEWWQDSLAGTKSGFLHAISLIASRAGIETRSLLVDASDIECRDFGQLKFKRRKDVDEAGIRWAKNIAAAAAELVVDSVRQDTSPIGSTAAAVRRKILKSIGEKTVTLMGVVDACWSHGIPVLFVGHLPPGFRRLDGLAACVYGRPAIVVSKKSKSLAWLLFIVAHELGHVCCGHVGTGIVVDESVDVASEDPEEAEANRFAVELLTGEPDRTYDLGSMLPPLVARNARDIGSRDCVDPGVVVLNHAFHHARSPADWGMINKALKTLEPDADAPRLLCEAMMRHLDLKGMDEDRREYIERLASVAAPSAVLE